MNVSPYVAHESQRLRLVKTTSENIVEAPQVRLPRVGASPLVGDVAVAQRPPAAVMCESRSGLSIVSSKAEYRATDYRFARARSDRLPLEKSPPLQSDGERLLRGIFCALSISAALALIVLMV